MVKFSLLLLLVCFTSLSFCWHAIPSTGQRPSFRSSPSWGIIPGTNDIYLFGGAYDNFDTTTTMYNDLYHYSAAQPNIGTWTQIHGWNNVSTFPSARAFSGYATTSAGLYVYGGAFYTNPNIPTLLSDFWLFNVHSQSWTQIPLTGTNPGGRAASAMTTVGNNLYLYGGINTNTFQTFTDLWKYTEATNAWSLVNAGGASNANNPPGMENHVMVSFGNTVYVGFGETFSTQTFQFGFTNGMWSTDVSSANPSWTFINPPSTPSTRNYVGAATDSTGRVIIVAGDTPGGVVSCGSPFNQNPINQTVVFSPILGNWFVSGSCGFSIISPCVSPAPASFPYGLKRHRALFNPNNGGSIYLFGGYGWDATSATCATRQEWQADIFVLSELEVVTGLLCPNS